MIKTYIKIFYFYSKDPNWGRSTQAYHLANFVDGLWMEVPKPVGFDYYAYFANGYFFI